MNSANLIKLTKTHGGVIVLAAGYSLVMGWMLTIDYRLHDGMTDLMRSSVLEAASGLALLGLMAWGKGRIEMRQWIRVLVLITVTISLLMASAGLVHSMMATLPACADGTPAC